MDKTKRGLHNWRNLFRKPSFQDWMILFMLIMVLFMAWAYQHDIEACQNIIKQYQEREFKFNPQVTTNPLSKLNLSDFVIENGST